MSYQYCEFRHFLGNFSSKVICFILYYSGSNTLEENLTERELMLLLVWTNSSVCSDNTQALVTSGSDKNQKVIQKHQHVTFKHNTDQPKIQITMDSFLF